MNESGGWFRQMLARRVPQIVGLYLAATWMTIEVGEWIGGRLGWPDQVEFGVFVLMVALLPSVALLAWNHGARGRDYWPRYEKWLLPINSTLGLILLFAVWALGLGGSNGGVGEARAGTVERVLVDETGQEQVFRVAREGFHVRATAFFWTRFDGEPPTWENYAIAWLLSVDLGRNPLLTIETPWTLGAVEPLQAAGHPAAVGEPVSLALQIGREHNADMIIRGRYEQDASGYRLTGSVIEVASGRSVAEHEVRGTDLIETVAALGDLLGPDLNENIGAEPAGFVDLDLGDAATSNPDALRFLVEAVSAVALEKDFDRAVALTDKALDLDPQFALAWNWLQRFQRARGDVNAARNALEQALAFDYKLDSSTLFQLKAALYGARGELDKEIRVLEMWGEVHPQSIEALSYIAKLKAAVGEPGAARAALEQALSLDAGNAEFHRRLAEAIELERGPLAAAEVLEGHLRAEPADVAAWVQLGDIRFRAGDFEAARTAYERAEFVSGSSFGAALGLCRIDARSGNLEAAIEAARDLIRRSDVASERAWAAIGLSRFLAQAGRLEAALELVAGHEADFRRSLSPLAYPQIVGWMKTSLLTGLGRFDEALTTLDALSAELVEPLDAIIDVYRIDVHELTRDTENANRSWERLVFFREEYNFPGRDAILDYTHARLKAAEGDYGAAADLAESSLAQFRLLSRGLDIDDIEDMELTLARYLRADGRPDEARALLRPLTERHINHAEARLELAEIEFEAGNPEAARAHLARVRELWAGADPGYVANQRAATLHQRLAGQADERYSIQAANIAM